MGKRVHAAATEDVSPVLSNQVVAHECVTTVQGTRCPLLATKGTHVVHRLSTCKMLYT